MSFDEKIATLDAAVAGTGRFAAPPSGGGDSGTPPSGGGSYTPPSPEGAYGWTGLPPDTSNSGIRPPSSGGGGYAPPTGGGGGGGGSGSSDPYLPSNRPTTVPGQQVAKAGMGDFFMPAMVGIGVLAVLSQSKKKGRARRNPRRRMRRSA